MQRKAVWVLVGTAVLLAANNWLQERAQPTASATTCADDESRATTKLGGDDVASIQFDRELVEAAQQVAQSVDGPVFRIPVEAMQLALHGAAIGRSQHPSRIRWRPLWGREIETVDQLRAMSINWRPSELTSGWKGIDVGQELSYFDDLILEDLIAVIDAHVDDYDLPKFEDSRVARMPFGCVKLRHIVDALARTRDERVIKPLDRLQTMVRTKERFSPSHQHRVEHDFIVAAIKQVEWAIGKQPHWSADQRLLDRISRDARKHRGERFGETEVALAIRCLHSDDPEVCEACISTLADIGTPEAVKAQLQEVHSPNSKRRQAAISAIGMNRSRWAVPLLLALLRDDSLFSPMKRPFSPVIPLDEVDAHPTHESLRRTFEEREMWIPPIKCDMGFVHNVRKETPLLEQWWQRNAAAFLRGDETQEQLPRQLGNWVDYPTGPDE